jgi:integrase
MLTDLKIKNLSTPSKRKEVPDGKIGGLYLVLQPSGARSWALRYRVDGLPRKLTLGSSPNLGLGEARRKAQEALGAIAGGRDPAKAKRAARESAKAARADEDNRVARVAELFLERYVKHNVGASWGKEVERLLRVEILPRIGAKRIGDVTKHDILAILDAIVDRGSPVAANRALAVLRRFFNWAADVRGLIMVSPCKGIDAPTAEMGRDRVLGDHEIRAAWAAFEGAGEPFEAIAKLLLLTGARCAEIAEARWHEIDLAGKTLTIAKERSKNGVAHEFPLSPAALKIIDDLTRVEGKAGYLFTRDGLRPVRNLSRLREAVRRAAIERGGGDSDKVAPTLHDLRRTVASRLAELGIAPHVIEKILNHRSGTIRGVARVYNRYSYSLERRQALDAWARRLDAIVSGAPAANVVEFASARA